MFGQALTQHAGGNRAPIQYPRDALRAAFTSSRYGSRVGINGAL